MARSYQRKQKFEIHRATMQTSVLRFRDLHHLSALINDGKNCVKAVIAVDHTKGVCLYEVNGNIYKSHRAKKKWSRILITVNSVLYLTKLYKTRCADFSKLFKDWCSYFPAIPFPNQELHVDVTKVLQPCPDHGQHKYFLVQKEGGSGDQYQLVEVKGPTVVPGRKVTCTCRYAQYWNGGKSRPGTDENIMTGQEQRLNTFQYIYGDYHGMSRKMMVPQCVRSSYGIFTRDGSPLTRALNAIVNSLDFHYNGKVYSVSYGETLIPLAEEDRLAIYNDSREFVQNMAWLNSCKCSTSNISTGKSSYKRDPYNANVNFHHFPELNGVDVIFKIGQEVGFLTYNGNQYQLSTGEYVDDPVIAGQTYTAYMKEREQQYIEHLGHLGRYQECQDILSNFWDRIAKNLGSEHNDYCGILTSSITSQHKCKIGWCKDTSGMRQPFPDKLKCPPPRNTKTTSIYYQILAHLFRWLKDNRDLGFSCKEIKRMSEVEVAKILTALRYNGKGKVGDEVNILLGEKDIELVEIAGSSGEPVEGSIVVGMDFNHVCTLADLDVYYQICTVLKSFFESMPDTLLRSLYCDNIKCVAMLEYNATKKISKDSDWFQCPCDICICKQDYMENFNKHCMDTIGLSDAKQKELKIGELKNKIVSIQNMISDAVKQSSYDVAHQHQVSLLQLQSELRSHQEQVS
jgi:hypothetical protein